MTGIDVLLLRTRAASALAVVVVLAGATVAAAAPRDAGAPTVAAMPVLDAQIAAGINAARAQRGLVRLRISRPLRASADSHSFEMARDGYFAHNSFDGTSALQRITRFYPSAGYRRWWIGETLLWDSPGISAAAAVREWLSDSPHRAILLTPSFREIGVSAVHVAAASGVFGGDEVTIVTADFGVRVR